ncbi:toxin-antitoxin system HicB family antitoxin [Paraburkholderia caffeinitolerans]|nr:toxin-antitoxin system HicB family antitoxin [Paraburkholderia caffeinitolerans]
MADRRYSGEFKVWIPPHAHRALVIQATVQVGNLNRVATAKPCS